ncbi:Glycosyltransferase involved in cell wall bisynthesis [Neorhodopirellula lusitana]|uniref:Glycosyltransferase involved in cell wall bisynthesis n=1 Tax=Neorhodopirellula lusitana TaxID=445327 RepID=A0ABY1PSG4_9BACT|nr:glycosyltransferase family 2 protein [Neorhodopirellula lusitana]SMP44134.1 Glycosyltransferase involved in cell wall bisynthesis [Neorhodopirellula lusitana]
MSGPAINISVVIPAYNAGATIRRAIDSVLAQSYPPLEIIVVDDGSFDDTADIAGRYGHPVRLIRQGNSQTAAARNLGISSSRGDWIAFLDADDYWDADKLAKQADVARWNDDVSLIASGYRTESPETHQYSEQIASPVSWCDRVLTREDVNPFLLGTRMWTGTVLVKRSALGDERFVSGLEPAEDRDLWVRLASRTSVWLMSDSLATCVLEAGSLSRGDIRKDCQSMLAVIDRHQRQMGFLNRLVWRSYTYYRWAAMEPNSMKSLFLLLQSFGTWPASLSRMPTMQTLGRSKRLVRVGFDLIGNVCHWRSANEPREASL